jgi:hypothetical protein
LSGFLLFLDMCHLFHLPTESREVFEVRLGTVVWPGGVQPRNFEEAIDILKNYPE